jgi:hypothetical protein
VSAIAFAGKESSDADDPNDHAAAEGLVSPAALLTDGECDRLKDARFPRVVPAEVV